MPPPYTTPPTLSQPAPWPGSDNAALSPAARRTRLTLLCALGLLAASLLAAWAIPPLLNWGRYRTAIAAIATAELGRPVVIGGEVTLRLLPEAVLTATDVTLPPPRSGTGDGVSAQVGALRLQVAIWPLLGGRIVLRDLVLGTPVLTLPWPLPDSLAHPVRPRLPHAFAAHVENGTLRIGGITITGITAAIHGGPVPIAAAIQGATAEAPNVAVFGAEGFAGFAARNWRFSSALGAPDADGVSAIDLSVHMLTPRTAGAATPAADTGGSVQATLADGIVQGRLRAGGPDLSLLMPASPLVWHLEAPFVASGERIETNAIRASLGGAPADGTALLQLDGDARLDARISAAAIDLDGWAALLKSSFPRSGVGGNAGSPLAPKLPLRIALAADSATLFAGTLGGLRATLVSDGRSLGLDQIEATLPGDARLASPHVTLRAAGGQITGEGQASLDAPDLAATLAWLQPIAPDLLSARPPGVLQRADVSFTASLSPGHLAITDLAGQVDGMTVAGGFAVHTAGRAQLTADLTTDHVVLDDWLGPPPALWPGSGLALLGERVSGVETNLTLAASRAQWGGLALGGVKAALHTGRAGLHIDHLEASLPGAHLVASGALARDGAITGGHMLIQAPDAQKMLALLPAAWGFAPRLWQGAGLIELAAEGPPEALSLQFRADANDLVLEAEALADTKAASPSATATITLRHPGTPRLLAALGLPAAETWLGTGSLALLAHLRAEGGAIDVQDFTLDGADMRLAGTLAIAVPGHAITGSIHADMLSLPGTEEAWGAVLAAAPPWLQTWHAHLHVRADAVEAGLRDIAASAAADLTLGSGQAFADEISAALAGGHLSAQLAWDTTQTPPRLALLANLGQATLAAPLGLAPLDLAAGAADLSLDVQSAGATPQALWSGLSGQAHATLHDGELRGLDLAQLAHAAALHPPRRRAAVLAALSQGTTPGLDGEVAARIDHGHAQLAPAPFTASSGAITLQGSADLTAGTIDLSLRLAPATTPTIFGLHVAGPWAAAKATQDTASPTRKARKK